MRIRTTVFASVVVAIALLAGATVLVLLQRDSMIDNLDGSAQSRAKDLAVLIRSDSLPRRLAVGKEEDAFAQVIDRGGRVVAASENVEGEPPFTQSGHATSVRTAQIAALGDEFRVVARRTESPSGPMTVLVGESLAPVREATSDLIALLAGGLPLLLLVVAGTVWFVTGRALRPVEQIRSQVASISGQDLDRRVPEPTARDEIGRLAHTMNAMLDRLEDAYARQGRFISDASHELQTPIAALRARLDVDLAHPERADWHDTEQQALEDVSALQRLAEDLLTLARLPTETRESARTLVDLDDLVLREAERIRTRALVRVDLHNVSSGQIEGSAAQLQRVVRNLLDNAERHATSTVSVGVATRGDEVVLAVADDGPGVPLADRERIFERFARLDDARTPLGGGTGLGLAIAREIVHAHHGTLTIEDSTEGASFVARLPVDQGVGT